MKAKAIIAMMTAKVKSVLQANAEQFNQPLAVENAERVVDAIQEAIFAAGRKIAGAIAKSLRGANAGRQSDNVETAIASGGGIDVESSSAGRGEDISFGCGAGHSQGSRYESLI